MALTKIPANLLDKSSHVDFADSERLRFGNDQDLQIYHDGSNSYITDVGTGNLNIQTNGVGVVISDTSASDLAVFNAGNGIVTLYKSGSPKLATTSTGIAVTGTATGAFSGTTATASGGTNTTALASTAFVQQELTTLIGGAPSTLNDLNELAAAINDDANYNTTLTTALGTKLPKAGGTMTGALKLSDGTEFQLGDSSEFKLKHHASGYTHLQNTVGTLFIDSDSVTFRDDDGSPTNVLINQSGLTVSGTGTFSGKTTMGGDGAIVQIANSTAADSSNTYTLAVGSQSGNKSILAARDINTTAGSYQINGSAVIDSSRNHFGASYSDGYVTWSAAQFNRYGAAIELQFTPTNTATVVKIGANGSNPTVFNAYTGNVSIGTGSPNAYTGETTLTINGTSFGRLDLESGGALRSSLFSGSTYTALAVGTSRMQITTSSDIKFLTSNAERVSITDAGVSVTGSLNSSLQVKVAGSNAAGVAFSVGDTGTGWYNTGSNSMGYSANGANKLTINNSGGFDFVSDIRVSGTSIIGKSDDTDTYLQFNSANQLRVVTGGAQRFAVNNSGIAITGLAGIGTSDPFSKLQTGANTFSGGHGMYTDGRVGISNHGSLTGLMLASTYNDASHPEYGLVFVQGPSTSSYNVWSISPDGPAKGTGLNFHYGAQATNIHAASHHRITFKGDGKIGIGTTNPTAKLQIGNDWTNAASYGTNNLYVNGQDAPADGDPRLSSTADIGLMITSTSTNTAGPDQVGLVLHNDNTTAGAYSPMLLFTKRESGSSPYKATMAGIWAEAPAGTGNGNSWIDGQLHFGTAGAATTGVNSNMVISKEGNVGIGQGAASTVSRLKTMGASNTANDYSFEACNSSSNTRFIVRNDGESNFYNASNQLTFQVGSTGTKTFQGQHAFPTVFYNSGGYSRQTVTRFSMTMTGNVAYVIQFAGCQNGGAHVRLTGSHWTSTYGTGRESYIFTDSYTSVSELNQFNHSTATSGGWTITRASTPSSNSNLVITKTAGNYVGTFVAMIEITSPWALTVASIA